MKVVLSLFLVLGLGFSSSCSKLSKFRSYGYAYPTEVHRDSPDSIITAKVKETIIMDSYLSTSSKRVSVTTNDGVVTLSGNVASKREMYRITKLVRKTQGVTSVVNQMSVGS